MRALPRLLLISGIVFPGLVHGQSADSIRSLLKTVDIRSGRIETVFREDSHFEAPNWSPDGRFFVMNRDGRLYRLAARGGKRLDEIATGFATRVNNDHGISSDGRRIVISHAAEENVTDPKQVWLASSIYVLPFAGSATPHKVTTKAPSFWHGWSPDGKTLAFVGRRDEEWDIYAISASGGDERRLTTCHGLDDGPDYSPNGKFICRPHAESGCDTTPQHTRDRHFQRHLRIITTGSVEGTERCRDSWTGSFCEPASEQRE